MSQQSNSVSLTHVVRKPLERSAGKPPLLILLHGVRSNEQDLIDLGQYLDERFLIVSLRAPLTLGPGQYAWYNIEFTAQGMKYDGAEAERGLAAAEKVIGELVAAYDVDPERVYLMGFSQGSIMSLGIALTHPELIAGAVIMSGRVIPEVVANAVDPERMQDLPLFVAHGTNDEVLSITYGREIRDLLTNLPVKLTYREYAMGHNISNQSLADITEWLTGQLKAPRR